MSTVLLNLEWFYWIIYYYKKKRYVYNGKEKSQFYNIKHGYIEVERQNGEDTFWVVLGLISGDIWLNGVHIYSLSSQEVITKNNIWG